MNKNALQDWLLEQDIPAAGGQPDPAGGQAPMTDPTMSPDVTTQPPADMAPPIDQGADVSQDPQAPDMPEKSEHGDLDDFEVWKNKYFKDSIKGDTNHLMNLLSHVRNKEGHKGGLKPYERKFVEDNWNIQLIRSNANVDQASKEIRKLIRGQIDKNNPATSVVNHVSNVLETMPSLNNIYIKLGGYGGLKGDLFRKYYAALVGAVQVGSGADQEDIIYNERDYSIMMSTRFNSRWGDVALGNWSLREDDPERYLSEPELKRLQEGSPEEKDVLRRRIVLESIAKQFETRAFIVTVVDEDGTIHSVGWDISNSLRGAYADGKLVVKTRRSENSEAMIDDGGNIIPLVDLSIYFAKETGQQDEEGMPEKEEIEFMERRDGMLFLTGTFHTIKDASSALSGIVLKETAYRGNPSDLLTLRRCVYSAHDLLMRQC